MTEVLLKVEILTALFSFFLPLGQLCVDVGYGIELSPVPCCDTKGVRVALPKTRTSRRVYSVVLSASLAASPLLLELGVGVSS